MASNLIAMASNLKAMASNLKAMASSLRILGFQTLDDTAEAGIQLCGTINGDGIG